MRDLDELRFNEHGRSASVAPPTEEQIAAFEFYFGLILPEDYITFLKHTNGGSTELCVYHPLGAQNDAPWVVNRFFSLDPREGHSEELWFQTMGWQSIPSFGQKIVPIANDGGSLLICLVYDSDEPTVQVCITDENCRFVYAERSFSAFLDLLIEDRDEE